MGEEFCASSSCTKIAISESVDRNLHKDFCGINPESAQNAIIAQHIIQCKSMGYFYWIILSGVWRSEIICILLCHYA